MIKHSVQATVPAKGDQKELSATINVEFPDYEKDAKAALAEAEAAYGAEAVLSNAFANWRITLQSNIRNGLKRGEDQATLQTRLGSAKMGVATKGVTVDPVQAYLAKFQSATPEAQKAMLAELQARAAKK